MNTKQLFKKGLNKEISNKAIHNTPPNVLKEKPGNLSEALMLSFPWQKSPEGFNFWHNIFKEVPN